MALKIRENGSRNDHTVFEETPLALLTPAKCSMLEPYLRQTPKRPRGARQQKARHQTPGIRLKLPAVDQHIKCHEPKALVVYSSINHHSPRFYPSRCTYSLDEYRTQVLPFHSTFQRRVHWCRLIKSVFCFTTLDTSPSPSSTILGSHKFDRSRHALATTTPSSSAIL